MISTAPGSLALEVLAALVRAEGATAAELAADLFALPALTLEQTTGPVAERLALLRTREGFRQDHERRVSRLLGRLQEAGLVETRAKARPSASWRFQVSKAGEAAALRTMSGWVVLEADAAPYLALIARVESQPGCVGSLGGQDGARYRQLVAWDVLVAPSQRWATAAGVELVAQRVAA